jgi:MFS family permease
MALSTVARTTYRLELRRAVAGGILETAGGTFLMLIAVRVYEAGATAKGLLAAGGSVGLLLSPLVVSLVQRLGWPSARAAAALSVLGAASILVAALLPFGNLFIACSILAMTTAMAAVPLMTQIYQDNYPESDRGRLFSRAVMLRIIVAASFSALAGWALTGRLNEGYRWLLGLFGLVQLLSAAILSRYPSRPLTPTGKANPFEALRYVREDNLFRWMLISWMLMGFGNLMMMPLRVEYLANPKYGLAYSAMAIAVLTGIIPNITRLILNPIWGWLFDRMNFFLMRFCLNVGFMLGTISFFTGESTAGLVVGAMFYGVASAGGDIAWSLWVTKIAPPHRVADYMSVHTFFNGIRNIIAPILAFQLVGGMGVVRLGWISATLIAGASLMLIPEIRHGSERLKKRQVPEIQD